MKRTKQEISDSISESIDIPNGYVKFEDCVSMAVTAYNLALTDASKNVQMLYHDGHNKVNHPTKHHQSGADNLQVDKDSILSLTISQSL